MSSAYRKKQVQVMCQGGIRVRGAIHLAAFAGLARAFAQFVDFPDTSRFGRVRIALIKIGFFQSNPKRYNSRGTESAIDTRLGRNLRFEFAHVNLTS